jgi:hypothetical protein
VVVVVADQVQWVQIIQLHKVVVQEVRVLLTQLQVLQLPMLAVVALGAMHQRVQVDLAVVVLVDQVQQVRLQLALLILVLVAVEVLAVLVILQGEPGDQA